VATLLPLRSGTAVRELRSIVQSVSGMVEPLSIASGLTKLYNVPPLI